MGVFLEVDENSLHGYQFAVHGELNCDQKELFNLLMDKVIKAVNSPSLKLHRFPNGYQEEVIAIDQVIGRVDYNETSNGNTPLIIIDGKSYT